MHLEEENLGRVLAHEAVEMHIRVLMVQFLPRAHGAVPVVRDRVRLVTGKQWGDGIGSECTRRIRSGSIRVGPNRKSKKRTRYGWCQVDGLERERTITSLSGMLSVCVVAILSG